MTWSLFGWIFIGLTAVLLVGFFLVFRKGGDYPVREETAIKRLYSARVRGLEKGKKIHLGMGQRMWSNLYPGLGLHSLSVLPNIINREVLNSGALGVSSGDGVLVMIAHQISQNQYDDGYSFLLDPKPIIPFLPGPTPLSSAMGLMMLLGFEKHASLALVGNYGLESVLFSDVLMNNEGHFFSATGNLTSQAVLFPGTRDLLIGENVFLMPGSFSKKVGLQAGWITEDILRLVIIGTLIAAVILKLVGLL